MRLITGIGLVILGMAACRHDCRVSGQPVVHFSVVSCCGSQRQYYWDDTAKDCIELSSIGAQNCGCICQGKDCDRLFWFDPQSAGNSTFTVASLRGCRRTTRCSGWVDARR